MIYEKDQEIAEAARLFIAAHEKRVAADLGAQVDQDLLDAEALALAKLREVVVAFHVDERGYDEV